MGISLAGLSLASKIKVAISALLIVMAVAAAPQVQALNVFLFDSLFSGAAFLWVSAYVMLFFFLMPLYKEASNPFLRKNYPWIFSALVFLKPAFESAFYFVFTFFAFSILAFVILVASKTLGLGSWLLGSGYFVLALCLLIEVFSGLDNVIEKRFRLEA